MPRASSLSTHRVADPYVIDVKAVDDGAADRLAAVERLARWMDGIFTLPGTRFRFGLDPLLGLIPGIGNLATFLVSAALIRVMARHGASGEVLVRMAGNVLVDAVVGAIPVIGNLFDFAFRANERNVVLLKRHYGEGRYRGSGRLTAALILAGVFGFLALAIAGAWVLVEWAWTRLFA